MLTEFRRLGRRVARTLQKSKDDLSHVQTAQACTGRLARLTAGRLQQMLESADTDREWTDLGPRLEDIVDVRDGETGGVNPGDRRALYYLVRGLAPRSVLEVGTHVGASTSYIAAALAHGAADGAGFRFTTVDIVDVNDGPDAYWKTMGLKRSPREAVAAAGGDRTRFVTNDALSVLAEPETRYDLIFLDGDHSAQAVYREVVLSLSRLNDGGTILLHDYFPDNEPLWKDTRPIAGPFLAMERLMQENPGLNVLPLGNLAWPTKKGSSATSLAIVTSAQFERSA